MSQPWCRAWGSSESGNRVNPRKHLAINLRFPANSVWPSQRHSCLGSLLRNPLQGRGAGQTEQQPLISDSPRPSSSLPCLTDLKARAEGEAGPHSNLLSAFSAQPADSYSPLKANPQYPSSGSPGLHTTGCASCVPVCGHPEGRFTQPMLAWQDVWEGQQRGQAHPLPPAEEHTPSQPSQGKEEEDPRAGSAWG